MHAFTCNICNSPCRAEILDRELPSCERCGSNVRFRWIVHTLSVELFGESMPLAKFPKRRNVRGFGMSDPGPIAEVLRKRFDYWNTYYHQEPRFDITSEHTEGAYDFIVASEVFEHVQPPVERAFANLARLLKPEGFVIFSTPWETEGDTIEHFPDLHDWELIRLKSGAVLVNRTAAGILETFEELNFHGGPGATLEMRVFSKAGLLASCGAAGFGGIAMAEDYPEFGIVWPDWSRGMVLRKLA